MIASFITDCFTSILDFVLKTLGQEKHPLSSPSLTFGKIWTWLTKPLLSERPLASAFFHTSYPGWLSSWDNDQTVCYQGTTFTFSTSPQAYPREHAWGVCPFKSILMIYGSLQLEIRGWIKNDCHHRQHSLWTHAISEHSGPTIKLDTGKPRHHNHRQNGDHALPWIHRCNPTTSSHTLRQDRHITLPHILLHPYLIVIRCIPMKWYFV